MDFETPTLDIAADVQAVGRIAAVPMILDVACRMTGMGFAAVARVTDGRWIACSVRDGIDFGLEPGSELPVETTLCNEVRRRGAQVVISDVAEDETYRHHPTPALYGFKSYISMPIVMPDGSFFGTLCAIDPAPHMLDTPAIIGSFKLFAELIAFHLDANFRIASSEATLLHEREIAELREQFIAVLGHDLRNPLAAVSAGVRILLRHPERIQEVASQINRSIARMAGLIDNVMDFARGRLGGGLTVNRSEDVVLAQALVEVVQELQSVHPERAIEIDCALDRPVRCDRARIEQLLSNLLANALTHGAVGQPVRVQASIADGVFELSVSNAGEPISPAGLQNLFQPFFRASTRDSQQGLGLGLYIASEIAKAHGGSLTATSTAVETRFTLRMPAGE